MDTVRFYLVAGFPVRAQHGVIYVECSGIVCGLVAQIRAAVFHFTLRLCFGYRLSVGALQVDRFTLPSAELPPLSFPVLSYIL